MRFKFLSALLACLWFSTLTPLRAELHPVKGPAVGNLGDIAQIQIPEGCVFFGKDDMKEFMEKTHNLYSDRDLGVLDNPDKGRGYLVLFSFSDIGYIKDAADEKLDADQMWDTMKSNNEKANEQRKSNGWGQWQLVQWVEKPKYNSQTQKLEWAVQIKDDKNDFVNYNTRVLGRRGVMSVVLNPNGNLEDVLPGFEKTLDAFAFTSGNQYAEWTTGDKVADIGLAALVVGGAGALAAKTGLLGKLWALIALLVAKGFKIIAVIFVVIGGFFKKLFGGGKKNDGDPPSSVVK